jgi:hypothetical protein
VQTLTCSSAFCRVTPCIASHTCPHDAAVIRLSSLMDAMSHSTCEAHSRRQRALAVTLVSQSNHHTDSGDDAFVDEQCRVKAVVSTKA